MKLKNLSRRHGPYLFVNLMALDLSKADQHRVFEQSAECLINGVVFMCIIDRCIVYHDIAKCADKTSLTVAAFNVKSNVLEFENKLMLMDVLYPC